MHDTVVVLKKAIEEDGLVKLILSAPLERIRLDPDTFEHSYIKLYGHQPLYICDLQAAVTVKDRINIHTIGDIDEIQRMKKMWEEYKSGETRRSERSFVEPELRYSNKTKTIN